MSSMVIVTVKLKGEAAVRDLEVASDLPCEQLSANIARALQWDRGPAGEALFFDIEATPPGRILRREETLAQANAWDGSWLVLVPAAALRLKAEEISYADLRPPDSDTHTPPVKKKFVFKQIDE